MELWLAPKLDLEVVSFSCNYFLCALKFLFSTFIDDLKRLSFTN